MKAKLEGKVVVSMSMPEAIALLKAIDSQGLNAQHKRDRPVWLLWRTLRELTQGPQMSPEPSWRDQ